MASAAPTTPGRVATFSSWASEPSRSIASNSTSSAKTRAGTRMSSRADAGTSQTTSPTRCALDIEHHSRPPAAGRRLEGEPMPRDRLDKAARSATVTAHHRAQPAVVEPELDQPLGDELLGVGEVDELVEPVGEQAAAVAAFELDRPLLPVGLAVSARELAEGGERVAEERRLGRRLQLKLEFAHVLPPPVHASANATPRRARPAAASVAGARAKRRRRFSGAR